MTRDDAENLVYNLIDAVRDIDRAASYNHRRCSEEYETAREKLITALISQEANEDPSGQRREPMQPSPLDDEKPF